MTHPIDKAASIVGSQVVLARRLGRTKAAINQWKLPGRFPTVIACVDIEQIPAGEVKRWHLRPIDWHRVWPELVNAPGAPPVPGSDKEVALLAA